MPDKKLTILLVEDDRVFTTYALQALRGNNNITALNAKEAIEKFRYNSPDITFLDINLPDGSGLDLLHEMKMFKQDAFIVMMTGSDSGKDIYKAKEHGASAYILKPFNIKKVQDCIDKFINYKNAISESSKEDK